MPVRFHLAANLALRLVAALPGGYAFTWSAMSALIATLFGCGMDFHDAEQLAAMLGLLLYPGIVLWAFVAIRVTRLWLVLIGASAVMSGAAWWVQSKFS
jgi:hypothetical protein